MTRPLVCLLVCLVAGGGAVAAPTQLITPGATWRYLPLATNLPPNHWQQPAFDAAGWLTGRAGFSVNYSGYLQGSTLLPARLGESPLRAMLLRHEFEVEDPSAVLALFLRVEFEDGLVAWLNGVEVARRGYSEEDPIPQDALPSRHPVGAAEVLDLTDRRSLLVRGTNLLALEIRDADPGLATLYAWPELRANFLRGPFVQNVSSNQAVIVWRTMGGTGSRIEFKGVVESREMSLGAQGTEHVARLRELEPGTTFSYDVVFHAGSREVRSDPATLTTLRPAGDLDFVVIGDTGSGQLGQHLMEEWLVKEHPDLVLHVGDIVYPAFTADRADLRCFSEFEEWMRRTPLFPTAGNHEMYGVPADYLAAFFLPANPLTGTEFFYAFDHGDVHFLSLFVPWWGISELGKTGPAGERSAQYQWLTNDLATTRKPWKIVYFHQPPKSSGERSVDDFDLNGRLDAAELQEFFIPLLHQYDVRVVFSGHDHLWERFAPTRGVHFVVSGGGGALRYQPVQRASGSARVISTFHAVRARLRGGELSLEAVDPTGQVVDQFSIRLTPATNTMVQAAWHTPATAPTSAREDGNVPAERFDFHGQGLAGVSGLQANPGRVWVNNDREWIHIGLSDVMLWPSQTLVLLLGTKRVAGVKDLRGVGQEVHHPLSHLDLGFADFEPSMVCLLGDEYADGSFPDFQRPGTTIPMGQGIFYATSGMRAVEGAELRQFNSSPEVTPDPTEQNADFICVSVPRAALGNPLPGELLQLAAVVVSPREGHDPIRLELDSAFIGKDLKLGAGALSGMVQSFAVMLAEPPDGDVDLDGLGSVDEAAHGTDPRNPDSDADGLSDGWEVRHELDPRIATGQDGAKGDPDGDGYGNLEEFLSGTDPRDPAPTLRVSADMAGAFLRLRWRAIVGRAYAIETTDRLTSGFDAMVIDGFPRVATATNESITLDLPSVDSRWFRVKESPQ